MVIIVIRIIATIKKSPPHLAMYRYNFMCTYNPSNICIVFFLDLSSICTVFKNHLWAPALGMSGPMQTSRPERSCEPKRWNSGLLTWPWVAGGRKMLWLVESGGFEV